MTLAVLSSAPVPGLWTTAHAAKDEVHSYNFISRASEKVVDSVVNISVETETSKLFQKTTLVSSGSGFFIEPGFILTNAHVVSDIVDSSKVIVTTSDGVILDGYVHAMDMLADLALIRIKDSSLRAVRKMHGIKFPWPIVSFGDNEKMRLGDWVVAIGSPFGLQNTVTAGVVSSNSRKSNEIGGLDARVRYIQTDCVVHSGSSGGPLINLQGQVIGINTTRAESEGISFAIRIDTALGMIKQLLLEGRVMRPFLGIHMTSLTRGLWKQLDESGDALKVPHMDTGVLITNVLPSSPAQKAGIQALDVVTHVDGHPVASSQELMSIMGLTIGEPVRIDLRRNVPLNMDWGGSIMEYETIKQSVHDVFMHQKIQKRRETGV
ncbi:Serine protease htra2, mitochondrial [Kappamyces sp. JEL0829]|nr:Serine protease htra2, mitochondrial [Kappamyces sp. JEL0829]